MLSFFPYITSIAMFLAPYITVFVMATIFSLLIAPRFEVDYSSLKYITETYPYSLVKQLIGTQSSSSPNPYQQTGPKTIIKSNAPTTSDTVFRDQEPAWKPIESFQSDNYDSFYYSDEYAENSMGTHPIPFLFEYLPFLLYSIRILAINAWHDSDVFHQPEATFESGNEQGNTKSMFAAEDKDSESLQRICEVLMLSGLEYDACQSLDQHIAVDQATIFSPWTEADEMGIKWKEVRGGADKGCVYFIKADTIPLKLSATPNEDGTTKLSYYTKNTLGSKLIKNNECLRLLLVTYLVLEYCPEDDDPAEVERFYKKLIDEIQPDKLTVFLNTKVYGEFTVYDLFEFQMLMDACLIALYKSLSQGGPPTRKTLIGFFTLYGIAYGLYYTFVKQV
ncbi:hypothetical protein MAM1_0100d05212 [Mucor ambiguus]|uniref:Uncharacterized protein n=1 Tax=Mucor ambiguus TaxID=91626 RepID=A0A0C9MR37_9FUNG|nr:hypothetical protein MAM1_0100d05212 [Mucor ambiguus]